MTPIPSPTPRQSAIDLPAETAPRNGHGLPASPLSSSASKLAWLAQAIMAPSRYQEAAGLPIPEADCRALIEAASADSVPAAPEEALALARTLTGLYRRAEFEDATLFCTGLAALFAAYPASLGRQVVDPVRGLPARQKFPPALAEVREALDAAQGRRNAVAWRARYLLEERARREAEAARPTASAETRAAMLTKLRALRAEPAGAGSAYPTPEESGVARQHPSPTSTRSLR